MSSLKIPSLTIVRGTPPDAPSSDDDTVWESHRDHHGRVCASTRATDGGGGLLYLPGLAGYRFAAGLPQVEAFPEPGVADDTVTEGYYRVALPLALQAGGYEVLHASGVQDARGVHVFCGASGAGKSTVAYALGRRDFQVWADDAVTFTVRRGRILAVPLPFALRLRNGVARFFEEPGSVSHSMDRKTEVSRHQGSEPLPIASVSLLERSATPSITRLSASHALPSVLYHSFYFSLADNVIRRRMAAQFLELVAGVPIFRISPWSDFSGIDRVLDELEEHVLTPV